MQGRQVTREAETENVADRIRQAERGIQGIRETKAGRTRNGTARQAAGRRLGRTRQV